MEQISKKKDTSSQKMNITIEFCILKLVYVQNWTKCSSQICPKRVFLVENRKGEQHHGLLHFQTGLSIKFLPKLTIFIFWTKFAQKGYFPSQTKKETENGHRIPNIEIKFCTEFHLKLTLSWTKFVQTGCFQSKSVI